jgi:hypothetical protein
MIGVNQLETEVNSHIYQKRDFLERHALKLAAAWSDFDMVEHSATEIVRRYGAIRPTDHGLLHLHKEPMFIALQTACVIGYTRPFSDSSGLDAKYSIYPKPEWQDLHETLFVWKERLSGDLGVSFRQFVVARDSECNNAGNRYILGEVTSVLKPFRHFSLLRRMCADRKALLWKDCQDAISECCPTLYDQTLLSLSRLKSS